MDFFCNFTSQIRDEKMIRSKLPEPSRTALAEIKKIAETSSDCINMAAAVPALDMPQQLKNCIAKHLQTGTSQYAPVEGLWQLRKAVSDYMIKEHYYQYDPDTDITVTAGASEAIWAAITAIIHEDDEVIIIEPCHENYVPAIRINGGTPIFVTLRHPDYRVDWNEVIRMINQRTKMIIVNSPHTPSGMVYTDDDYRNLQKIVVGNKITVLADETFSFLTFGKPFVSITKFPALAKQSIVISSISKAMNATGWKTGICCAPADITAEIRRMHNYICNGSNSTFQYAVSEVLSSNPGIMEKIRDAYQAKRDLLCSLLKDSKYKLIPSEGTWFQLVDYSEISSEPDTEFCLRLAKDYSVAAFPMSTYYHNKTKTNVIRICFARPDEVIRKGAERLLKACAN